MPNCIFCKIINGEISSSKIYEDELVYAFFDIAPINLGHTLVIPKEHYVSSSSIPEKTSGRMFYIGTKIGIALRRVFDMDGYNLHLADGACAGQVVMHSHLHIIPRGIDDGFNWNWRQLEYDDNKNELLEKVISKLKEGIKL